MRFGPVAVPVAIVAALFVIVGAEAGWFDGTATEPSFIRADAGARKVAAASTDAPARPSQPSVPIDRATASSEDAPVFGRSVGRGPVPAVTALGTGGASLDADGVAAAGPQELLRQAREEASKAKQDVVDVTRAALDAQHASEAEFARQLGEANDRNAELAAGLDQARKDAEGLKQQHAAPNADGDGLRQKTAQAEAAAKAAADALARSRETENRLAAELAVLRAETERKGAAAADAREGAAQTLAARDAALKRQADDLAHANDALAAQRDDAGRQAAEIAALRVRAASLRLTVAVETGRTAHLREEAVAAERREVVLGRENAELRATAALDVASAQTAARTAASKASAAGDALARSEGTVRDLQAKLAALDVAVSVGRSAVSPSARDEAVVRLKGDLDGARRGEDTLRKENGMLQRQLAEAQASGKMLGEKLAALQVGAGLAKGEPLVPKPQRERRTTSHSAEHQRLLDERSALQRQEMQGEIDALRREANGLGKPRARRSRLEDQGAHIVTVKPVPQASSEAMRGRDRRRDAADGRADAPADDSRATIAQAKIMIRAGHLDQARRMLSQRGGADATRALADSYNPLTNTDYGAIGVDSDTDKAAYLYQQASRMPVRDR